MQSLSFKNHVLIRKLKGAATSGALLSLVMTSLLSMAPASDAAAATKKFYAGERTAYAANMNAPYWLGMQHAKDYCAQRGGSYMFWPRGDLQKTRNAQYALKYYFECYK